jgi:hypothetical protein
MESSLRLHQPKHKSSDRQHFAQSNTSTPHQILATLVSHLLHDHQQTSTDTEVWHTFQSRQRITIVSKEILWEEAGTFGWKVTTLTNKVLFKGCGPVDGPNKTGSYIRSKLRGFTAPLLLVTTLAKHWGLRHRCKFRWLAESKAAINQVQTVIQKTTCQQHSRTTATICQSFKSSPANSDNQ